MVEDETAEQAVFSIGNKRKDLAGRTRQKSREARSGKFDKLSIFAASVGNHFVMERLAETVRKIAIVRFERVGKRVALGFKN